MVLVEGDEAVTKSFRGSLTRDERTVSVLSIIRIETWSKLSWRVYCINSSNDI